MAEAELYDYLSVVTPDYDTFLSVLAPKSMFEETEKNQVIHDFDDGSERVVTLGSEPISYIKLIFTDGISKSDAGTILDFYHDVSKANGFARSFKYAHTDGHTYVVKFRTKISRDWNLLSILGLLPVKELRLKIIGVVAD